MKMKRRTLYNNGILVSILVLILTGVAGFNTVMTAGSADKEAEKFRILINHRDVFGKLTRPPVEFKHDFHAGILNKEGCGECHHVYDEKILHVVFSFFTLLS